MTLGYSRDELLGHPMIDLVHPDDREATTAEYGRLAVLGEDTLNFHNRFRHRDGSYRWLEWMIRPDATTESFYAIARDVTTRKEGEESLRQLLEQLAIIQRAIAERSRLDEILDTIVQRRGQGDGVRDRRPAPDRRERSVLRRAGGEHRCRERSTGVLRRGPISEGIGGRAIVEERLLISNPYGSGQGEIPMLAADGLRAAMAAPVYGHGSIVGSLVVATRTEREFSEADAETLGFFAEYTGVALSTARAADAVRQALTDPLTGLPNRALFVDRLDHALARAERANGEVSVIFLDLDEFKLVNDSLGHLAGDQLLVETASVRECMRRRHRGRLGGDEFAVLSPRQTRARVVGDAHHRGALAPFRIDGHELHSREHRHRHQAQRAGEPAPRRRHRDVPRQGDQARRTLRLRAGHAGRHRLRARARQRASARRRAQRDLGRVPADRLARRRPDRGLRSAVRWTTRCAARSRRTFIPSPRIRRHPGDRLGHPDEACRSWPVACEHPDRDDLHSA